MSPNVVSNQNTGNHLKALFIFIFAVFFSVSVLIQGSSKLTETFPSYRAYRNAPKKFDFSDFSGTLNKSGAKFWESIKPSFKCPLKLLEKVGGKWTCGLSNLGRIPENDPTPCVVYSFGVNKDSSFESEVLATTHCEVFAYDPTVDTIGHPLRSSNLRVHFRKLGIAGKDIGIYKTLKTLMEENGGHKWIDILKIDVEGAEYESLSKILEDFPQESGLPFGQLLLEVHIFNWNGTPTAPSKAEMVVNFYARKEGSSTVPFRSEFIREKMLF